MTYTRQAELQISPTPGCEHEFHAGRIDYDQRTVAAGPMCCPLPAGNLHGYPSSSTMCFPRRRGQSPGTADVSNVNFGNCQPCWSDPVHHATPASQFTDGNNYDGRLTSDILGQITPSASGRIAANPAPTSGRSVATGTLLASNLYQ